MMPNNIEMNWFKYIKKIVAFEFCMLFKTRNSAKVNNYFFNRKI